MRPRQISVEVNDARPRHAAAIRHVHEQAFGRGDEAELVEKLTERDSVTLSLVAIRDGHVVGHVLFSPVTIESGVAAFHAVGLGPMAVLPSQQRRGIGSQLLRAGLDRCRGMGHEVVVVLGHPDYYPRFGFQPARRYELACEFDVPADAFMVLELRKGALAGVKGCVRYQPEFAAAS